MARLAVTAAAVASVGIATATPASANGGVNWVAKQLGTCLSWDSDNYATTEKCTDAYNWDEARLRNGSYELTAFKNGSWCLDGNGVGRRAYLGRCAFNHDNPYQQWYETKTSRGWVLKNAATGECLGALTRYNVRAISCGDSATYWD
ncbi:hypothetical protein [Streptomyces sp. I05A-00742]|uniref:hypothetical protein n=1 Tax=Streptomyces sp. I05A-00742 TaxID=2732853 RepID=UPI001488A4B1|nr:hypothetical protein [Streptomyces sp. I05A-00742]